MDLGISGKSAIVCGASSGIGRAVAFELGKEGARVLICSRHEERIKEVALELKSRIGEGEIVPFKADVSKKEDVKALVGKASDEFGGVDILFTNAAGPRPGRFMEISDEDWNNAFNMTLMSVIYLSRECIPIMKQRGGGSIVNNVSISVKQPLPNLVLSNSIRMAVIGLAKTLSFELAQWGIRVNNVCPAHTRTPRVESLLSDTMNREGISREEALARLVEEIPLRRIGEPEEVASLVAFLCSERAKFITGSTLFVDGGSIRATL
jgi:3-oxoacyl-[acyl-carrier protein] reductase